MTYSRTLLAFGVGPALAASTALAQPVSIPRATPPLSARTDVKVHEPTNFELRQQITDLTEKVDQLTILVQSLSGQVSAVNDSLTTLRQKEGQRYRIVMMIAHDGCRYALAADGKSYYPPDQKTVMCSGKSLADKDLGPPWEPIEP